LELSLVSIRETARCLEETSCSVVMRLSKELESRRTTSVATACHWSMLRLRMASVA